MFVFGSLLGAIPQVSRLLQRDMRVKILSKHQLGSFTHETRTEKEELTVYIPPLSSKLILEYPRNNTSFPRSRFSFSTVHLIPALRS